MKIKKENLIKIIIVGIVMIAFLAFILIQKNKHPSDRKLSSIPLTFLLDMELNDKEEKYYKDLSNKLMKLIHEREYSVSASQEHTERIMWYLHTMLKEDYESANSFISKDFWSEESSFLNEMAYDKYYYKEVEFLDVDTNGQEIILHLKIRNENRYIVLDVTEDKVTFDGYLISNGFLSTNFLYNINIEEDLYDKLDINMYVDFEHIWELFIKSLPEEKAIDRFVNSLFAYIEGMRHENHLFINSFTDYPHSDELANNVEESLTFFQSVKTHKVNITDISLQESEPDESPTLDASIVFELSFESDEDVKERIILLEERNKKIMFTDITND